MKKAYWIRNTRLFEPDNYECSVCGRKTDRPSDRCPGCGERMRGRKEGGSWVDEAAFLDFMDGKL